MKAKITLFGLLMIASSCSNAWTLVEGFERTKSKIGSTTDWQDGIDYYQNYKERRNYISGNSYYGDRAIEFRIEEPYVNGKSADTVWSAGIGLSNGRPKASTPDGGEVWARTWMYFSPNWTWEQNNKTISGSGLKVLRVLPFPHYEGELIVDVDTSQTNNGKVKAFTQNFEGGAISLYGGDSEDASGPSALYPIGVWFCLEAYLKVSSDPNEAKVRVWLNGELILERTGNKKPLLNRQTFFTIEPKHIQMRGPGVGLFSTWDVDSAQTGPAISNGPQYALYDNILVTTNPLRAQEIDRHGNKMLGLNISNDSNRQK